MSNIPISVQMDVAESAVAYNMTVEDQIVVNPSPALINMITNGDFSVAGATTDGWTTNYPVRAELAVSSGRLVMSCISLTNVSYGMQYAVNTESSHTYLIKYKFKKTLGDNDGDGKVVRIMLGTGTGTSGSEVCRKIGLSQNDIVEDVCAITAGDDYTTLLFTFGGGIATTAVEVGDSMLELYYAEMYDITDIVSGL